MRMHLTHSFDLRDKKQVLVFQLISLDFASKRKYKTALQSVYSAQTIVSELNEDIERNLDYLISVNVLTSYLLLQIGKPSEALEFALIAERIAFRLVANKNPNSGHLEKS